VNEPRLCGTMGSMSVSIDASSFSVP